MLTKRLLLTLFIMTPISKCWPPHANPPTPPNAPRPASHAYNTRLVARQAVANATQAQSSAQKK
jgi:hypothetical protein